MRPLWVIRILFLALCVAAGFAISQVRPEFLTNSNSALMGAGMGFAFGSILILIDELLKGFSLRAFSAITFGLLLGTLVAMLIDRSGLFERADEATRWMLRLGLFLAFGYIGIVLAMRSNKEDFSLIIPYVRFAPRNKPENLLLLDTSAIIDGRIAELIESKFVEGMVIVPRFVLKELQQIADSADPLKRARGRRGLEVLNRIQVTQQNEVKIHDGDFPEENQVDAKLLHLAHNLGAKLFTNDYNLGKIAELQKIPHVNLHELSRCMRSVALPGDVVALKVIREGREKGQGIGYMPDGTMVVINGGQAHVGQQVEAQVQSSVQTGAGIIIFTELKGVTVKQPSGDAPISAK